MNLLSEIVGIDGTVGTDDETMLNTWKKQLQKEFDDMIESVKENGGFYIGRYETSLRKGTDGTTIAQVIKGETSATAISKSANTWYGLYQKEKEYSKRNNLTNVVGSSMVWGSQYDQMMIWMQKNGIDVVSTTPIDGAFRNKERITGIEEKDKLNNIYDLIGNSVEWTLEAYSNLSRQGRGGVYAQAGVPSERSYYIYNYPFDLHASNSSRISLYVK